VRTFASLFGFFASWWGVGLIAALDVSVFFFLPFGTDALVVFMAARNRELFWVYPLLATAGSVLGAGVTFWIGRRAGEAGLDRLMSRHRLERLKRRLQNKGAVALALPAILPPPFPLTPFVLSSGALDVDPVRFFSVFAAARIVRFGAEAVLARRFGTGVLSVMQSPTFQWLVAGFVVVAIVGTAVSLIAVWRRTPGARTAGSS
jgi:membrane protein YqaA with SNARE-associated domain